MSGYPDKEFSQSSQKQLQPFVDCVAYLLAKRWLRDQRQPDEKPPQDRQGSDRAEPGL